MSEYQKNPKVPWWQPGLILFMRMSGWIAGPVILAVFIGKWLDKKCDTEPWLFLLSVGIAFLFSMFGIIKDAYREMGRLNGGMQKEKKKEKDFKQE